MKLKRMALLVLVVLCLVTAFSSALAGDTRAAEADMLTGNVRNFGGGGRSVMMCVN